MRFVYAWTARAKCLGEPVQVFDAETVRRNGGTKLARKLCAGCPVMRECAQFALDTDAVAVVQAGVILGSKPSLDKSPTRKKLRLIASGDMAA
ncbi:WhiB family transcriptional regulator [Nocardia sp. NPDC058058]|uniref:WhiB family transcriptional regulator n=1 Tax=Nocardia sp. NPDC058058 TaxID=3346317 RepID=UPI0036DBBE97